MKTKQMIHRCFGAVLAALAVLLTTLESFGQAPGLLWSTNLNARLFAVDAGTNVYANVGGSVIVLDGAGVPLQTNAICPKPGLAQRDAAGNFYFAGIFDGTQDFGGITLVGGWTNWTSPWTPGYPTCFLAKYSSAGVLQWVTSWGAQALSNYVTDVVVDPNGGAYAGYLGAGTFGRAGRVVHVNNAGVRQWDVRVDQGSFTASVSVGAVTESNCCFSFYRYMDADYGLTGGGRIHLDGSYTVWLSPGPLWWSSFGFFNCKPVTDDLTNGFLAGTCEPQGGGSCTNGLLRKFAPNGSYVADIDLGPEYQWTLARDLQANFYFAGVSNTFTKRDSSGNFIWATNYQKQGASMVVDTVGNRFLSFTDGSVARIADDPVAVLPSFLVHPQGHTVFAGSNTSFSASLTGTPPFRYFWRHEGTNLPGATNATLNLNNVLTSQAGYYTLVVSNAAGSVTSAPALLRVKNVAVYFGSQLLTNTTYFFTNTPTLSIQSAFVNGSIFYTLDGSTPTAGSTFYTGPFQTSNATVRAVAYSADFSQFEESDAVGIFVLPRFDLVATTPGGGTVSIDPPGGDYLSNSVVTVTATPAAGWTFLRWEGDLADEGPVAQLVMNADKTVAAVFGTTLSTSPAANGQIHVYPVLSHHAYGSIVRLTAVPSAGYRFSIWGNAAAGKTNNPLYFVMTNANPTISALFSPLSAGQASLTVLISGPGEVTVNPPGNAFATNQSVTLTATPYAGHGFSHWSGDASGTATSILVPMNQSRVITANFLAWPVLTSGGMDGQGYTFTLTSGSNLAYQIFGSTNLRVWQSLATITNASGQTQFTDSQATNLPRRFYKAVPAQ